MSCAEPIYRCDCGHVGPAELVEDGHEVYRIGDRVVYSPNFWECCGSCGAHIGTPALCMCAQCGKREACEGDDWCMDCLRAREASDIAGRGESQFSEIIRDIVMCQAGAR